MDLTNFSLIYPNAESQKDHYSGVHVPKIDMFVLEELGMLEILDLKNSDLSEFFTDDGKNKVGIVLRKQTFCNTIAKAHAK